MQPTFFPDGEDLPIFSGAPVTVTLRAFDPQPAVEQPSLLDLRPQFGASEPQYEPAPLSPTEETQP